MFRSHVRNDLWSWSRLSALRQIDDDFRRLVDLMWSPMSASYCDNNGVLNLTPSYRLKQTKTETNIEIEIPGVARNAVALEAQGNRLKIVAAKYSPDDRSCLCSKDSGAKSDGKSGTSKQKKKSQPTLPTLVYKLRLRLSSRADLDHITAKYRGDGVLRVTIPTKEEEVRKVAINIED